MNGLAGLRWHRESQCPAAQQRLLAAARTAAAVVVTLAPPILIVVNAPVAVEPISLDG